MDHSTKRRLQAVAAIGAIVPVVAAAIAAPAAAETEAASNELAPPAEEAASVPVEEAAAPPVEAATASAEEVAPAPEPVESAPAPEPVEAAAQTVAAVAEPVAASTEGIGAAAGEQVDSVGQAVEETAGGAVDGLDRVADGGGVSRGDGALPLGELRRDLQRVDSPLGATRSDRPEGPGAGSTVRPHDGSSGNGAPPAPIGSAEPFAGPEPTPSTLGPDLGQSSGPPATRSVGLDRLAVPPPSSERLAALTGTSPAVVLDAQRRSVAGAGGSPGAPLADLPASPFSLPGSAFGAGGSSPIPLVALLALLALAVPPGLRRLPRVSSPPAPTGFACALDRPG